MAAQTFCFEEIVRKKSPGTKQRGREKEKKKMRIKKASVVQAKEPGEMELDRGGRAKPWTRPWPRPT